jgi:hypothetical protein
LEALNRAIEINPDDAGYLCNKGKVLQLIMIMRHLAIQKIIMGVRMFFSFFVFVFHMTSWCILRICEYVFFIRRARNKKHIEKFL